MALTDEDKQWITGLLETRIDSLETNLIEHIDERTHDAETRLLRAFADYNT